MKWRRLRPFIFVLLGLASLALTLIPTGTENWVKYPDEWVYSPKDLLNAWMASFVATFGWLFRFFGWVLEWPVTWAQAFLAFVPWSLTTLVVVMVAYISSGIRLALFVAVAFLYMAFIGYWAESMNTLAIVLISVPMALAIGFAIGVWGFYSDRAKSIIMPMLDLLQTIPAFAYLLPILILFGFGTTVGLVASVLYAFPPMVRNTLLGLRSVPETLIEAGLMSGATNSQIFWKVRLPTAKNQILLGVNQTTMASLSMVIIAAIIGGTNDIGWEVLSTMRKAQFGESLLAGFVIALIAMSLDRISYGFATKDRVKARRRLGVNPWFMLFYLIVFISLLCLFIPQLRTWPETLVFNPAPAMNIALENLVVNGRESIEAIKNAAFFYIMLPIKIGLSKAVSPFTWGLTITPPLIALYASIVLSFAIYALWRGWEIFASFIVFWGVLSYIGLTNMPWITLYLAIIFGAVLAAGWKLGFWTAAGFAFLLVAGVWPQTVLSIYLCGVAVLICLVVGTAIGIWASQNQVVSTLIRPILDTLQTMPLFVILIPFVMVFKIGEFTALLAIIAYAIVPTIRYTEHGLRNLPTETLEAARAIGCSSWQLLWRVKMPLALPAIMLGLNQTIIYGIGMLVIAALVGTSGLGQQIYIGLGDGDFGVGITAGIGMAIIAMVADRMTQAVSKKKQKEYGLEEVRL